MRVAKNIRLREGWNLQLMFQVGIPVKPIGIPN
jgi:hypothetical protein